LLGWYEEHRIGKTASHPLNITTVVIPANYWTTLLSGNVPQLGAAKPLSHNLLGAKLVGNFGRKARDAELALHPTSRGTAAQRRPTRNAHLERLGDERVMVLLVQLLQACSNLIQCPLLYEEMCLVKVKEHKPPRSVVVV